MVSPPVITLSRATPARRPVWPVLIPAVIVLLVAGLFGMWWATLVVGLILGLLLGGFRSVWIAFLSGLLGWGLGLLWQDIHAPIGKTADVVAGIMGLGSGATIVVFTLLLGGLLAASGAWLGTAIRGFGRYRASA